jgi:hypothetical protein
MGAWRRADPTRSCGWTYRHAVLIGSDMTYATDRARSDRGNGKENKGDAMSAGKNVQTVRHLFVAISRAIGTAC